MSSWVWNNILVVTHIKWLESQKRGRSGQNKLRIITFKKCTTLGNSFIRFGIHFFLIIQNSKTWMSKNIGKEYKCHLYTIPWLSLTKKCHFPTFVPLKVPILASSPSQINAPIQIPCAWGWPYPFHTQLRSGISTYPSPPLTVSMEKLFSK